VSQIIYGTAKANSNSKGIAKVRIS